MTFSVKVKEELIQHTFEQECCNIASLSAFIRGAGNLVQNSSFIGFELNTENEKTLEFFKKIINNNYGIETKIKTLNLKSKKAKYSLTSVTDKSFLLLEDLGILSNDGGHVSINLTISSYLIENECCKKAYIIGAFLGSGSVIVPDVNKNNNTSYHLEFVFSKYQTASDFCVLLSECGFYPKLTERKDNYIIYFKNAEEISDILVFMGATKCAIELNDIVLNRSVKNDTNRKVNCEMGNLSKQIDASVSQIKAINLIKDTIGLESLAISLSTAAKLRLENPDLTLNEMAKLGNISKSCLNHRLRKIMEIAKNLG